VMTRWVGSHRRGISGDMAGKMDAETGEALLAPWRNPTEGARAITLSGKGKGRPEGDGLGRSTDEPGAVKRRGREGPRPAGYPSTRRGSVG
jgi:hypothetical protein